MCSHMPMHVLDLKETFQSHCSPGSTYKKQDACCLPGMKLDSGSFCPASPDGLTRLPFASQHLLLVGRLQKKGSGGT